MMMNQRPARRLPGIRTAIVALVLGLAVAVAAPARAVDLGLGTGIGRLGDVVSVPVTTSDLTGLDVVSFELNVRWGTSTAELVGVETVGTLTDGVDISFSSNGDRGTIVGSVDAPLSAAGTLLELQILLNGPNLGNRTFFFDGAILNEGTPAVTSLTNGQLRIDALPNLNVTPPSAEVLVGESVILSVDGGAAPYAFASTDPIVADFAGTDGELVGNAPGVVDVVVTEAGGTIGVSGPYAVRAIRLGASDVGGAPGRTVRIPLTITDPSAYGVLSAEFGLSWPANLGEVVGFDLVGTVAGDAGWTQVAWSGASTSASFALAGASPLAASGVLLFVDFAIDPDRSTSDVDIAPTAAVFNENLPAIEASGRLEVVRPPAISVSPDAAELVAGDAQAFTVEGPVTTPVIWSVTDPSVASIDGEGQLTALAEGTTRVRVEDAAGAVDESSIIRVCALRVQIPDSEVGAGVTTRVPVTVDRPLGPLSIYSYEIVIGFDETRLQVSGVRTTGTATEAWTAPQLNPETPGELRIVAAGPAVLVGGDGLFELLVEGDPTSIGQVRTLGLVSVLFNEGSPCSFDVDGVATIVEPATSAPPRIETARLEQNHPNPFNPRTSITFGVADAGRVRLRIFDLRGRIVRTLVDENFGDAGEFTVRWNGTDDDGHRVPSGVYHYRLDTGAVQLSRKMILIK